MPKNSMIKIMCMGDSITFAPGMPGSYRKFLYNNLIKKGYKIKMVGPNSNIVEKYCDENNSEYFEYEDNNCGYSGYTIKEFGDRKGLLEILEKNKCLKLNPDIIILLIGTNNAMENYDFNKTIKDFISLIDFLLNNINKEAIIFVSTIPDMDPNVEQVYNLFDNYRKDNINDTEVKNDVNNYIKDFNNKIKEIIEGNKSKNDNIRIVDLNPLMKNIDNLLFDGVHPKDKGYKIMGDFYAGIIEEYLNNKFNKK